jgi:class 3 adenylate cyclase
LRLAYQQWCAGPPLLIIPPLVSNIEVGWEHEYYRRVDEYLGRYMTCAQFDKRGVGLSDRPDEMPTLEQRIGDIVTVMDALGWERSHLLGLSEGGIMSQLFAAEYPDRVDHVILIDTFVSPRYWPRVRAKVEPGDPPVLTNDEILERFETLIETWGEDPHVFVDWFVPGQADNEAFVRWAGRLERLSASPRDFARQVHSVQGLDAGDAPERIAAPTLVMHVKGDRVLHVALGRVLADLIPGARYVEIPGEDHVCWVMPVWREMNDIMIEFCTGKKPVPIATRRFATVLFTDIVGSTSRSAGVGDTAWHEVLDQHDRIARRVVDDHAGRVVKSTGDGLLAVFEVPSQGVGCGLELCRELAAIDVPIRAGVHAGEIEVHDDGDISGIAVNLAARVEQAAADGELWVSSTVGDMMLGGAAGFDERGEHALKRIDGTWKLFAVR